MYPEERIFNFLLILTALSYVGTAPAPVEVTSIRVPRPFYFRPPTTQFIELSWTVPASSCRPNLFFIRYALHRYLACPEPEMNPIQREVRTNETTYTLTRLHPYSMYNISITAQNEAGESEARNVTANTAKDRPSIITHVTSDPSLATSTSLGFTWQPLTCRDINGDIFRNYFARVYIDGITHERNPASRQYIRSISNASVSLAGLESCTMYKLFIAPGNNEYTGAVSTAIAATSVSYGNLTANAYIPGSLMVSWSIPSKCSVSSYNLTYQLIKHEACPMSLISNSSIMSMNITATSGNYISQTISDLEDYAVYHISITAIVNNALSTAVYIKGTTRQGAPSTVQNLTFSASVAYLTFMWEDPPCEDINGYIDYYEYRIVYEPSGENVQEVIETRNKLVSITEGLYPCSTYRFEVRIVIMAGAVGDWKSINAATGISAPDMPTITYITALQEDPDETGLNVTWTSPAFISTPCQPTNYEIHYQLLKRDSCEDLSGSTRLELAGVVDGSTFSFVIRGLLPYSKYRIFVKGNTSAGYGPADSSRMVTGYSYPTGDPINVSLVITWEKPSCGERNGPITHYDFILYDPNGEEVTSGSTTEKRFSYSNNYYGSFVVRAVNYDLTGVYGPDVAEPNSERDSSASECPLCNCNMTYLWVLFGTALCVNIICGCIFLAYYFRLGCWRNRIGTSRRGKSSSGQDDKCSRQLETPMPSYQELVRKPTDEFSSAPITNTYLRVNASPHITDHSRVYADIFEETPDNAAVTVATTSPDDALHLYEGFGQPLVVKEGDIDVDFQETPFVKKEGDIDGDYYETPFLKKEGDTDVDYYETPFVKTEGDTDVD